MFSLAVMSQFVVQGAPLLSQYVVIGSTFVAVDIVVMSVYAGLAARLLTLLVHRQQRFVNRFFAVLFATAATVLAFVRTGALTTRPGGRTVLRMCALSPQASERHIRETIRRLVVPNSA